MFKFLHSGTRRTVAIISLIVLMTGVGFWAAFLKEWARPYNTTSYMPDTKIVRKRVDPLNSYGLSAASDRDVLYLARGLPHSTVTTAHGWSQLLTIEIPKVRAGMTVDLAKDDVRVTYFAYMGRRFWSLKTGTATGKVSIQSVSEDGVSATYDIKFTSISGGVTRNGNIEKDVTFQGMRVFAPRTRPGSKAMVGESVQEPRTSNTIHRAADRGDKDAVEKFLSEGVDVNAKGDTYLEEGWTPLHHAAFHGQKSVAELLLEKGAHVNAGNLTGWTPLHEAAWRGNADIAELLIAKGANVNAKCNQGRTPLDRADGWSSKAHEATASILRKHGGKTGTEH